MRIIAIANQKGGCGKTTTAINLSAALTAVGRTVLIIDLDPQSHASYGLGLSGQVTDKSIYNILTDNHERRRTLDSAIHAVYKNLDIIPSNILLSTLEQELKDKEDAVSRLNEVLADAKLSYDYVIIDCPPSLGFLTFNALRASELVIIPIDMSAFSLMGVGKLLGMLELIKVKINHSPGVNALATLFDKRTKYSQTMLDEIHMFFKDQMLQTVIRVNVALKKAAAQGVSVIQFDSDSNGARDYIALAKELVKQEVPAKASQETPQELPAEVPAETTAEPKAEETLTVTTPSAAEDRPQTSGSVLRETSFSIDAPGAKEIYLVGDFNHWKINDNSRLARLEDGRWEKRLALDPGKYRYKFVVDGEWVLDSQNITKEANPFGTFDSIITI